MILQLSLKGGLLCVCATSGMNRGSPIKSCGRRFAVRVEGVKEVHSGMWYCIGAFAFEHSQSFGWFGKKGFKSFELEMHPC